MGIVIQFKPAAPEQPAERRSDHLDDDLLTLAGKLQAIGANKASIDKDLRVIESIMRSTENPELGEQLLQQLKAVHDNCCILARATQRETLATRSQALSRLSKSYSMAAFAVLRSDYALTRVCGNLIRGISPHRNKMANGTLAAERGRQPVLGICLMDLPAAELFLANERARWADSLPLTWSAKPVAPGSPSSARSRMLGIG